MNEAKKIPLFFFTGSNVSQERRRMNTRSDSKLCRVTELRNDKRLFNRRYAESLCPWRNQGRVRGVVCPGRRAQSARRGGAEFGAPRGRRQPVEICSFKVRRVFGMPPIQFELEIQKGCQTSPDTSRCCDTTPKLVIRPASRKNKRRWVIEVHLGNLFLRYRALSISQTRTFSCARSNRKRDNSLSLLKRR